MKRSEPAMAAKKKKNVKKKTAAKKTSNKSLKKPAKKIPKKSSSPKKKPAKTKASKTKASKTKAAALKSKKKKIKVTKKSTAVKKKTVKKAAGSKSSVPVAASKPAVTKPSIDYTKAVTPLGDRLVVRVLSGERVTAGGLIIPDTASMATGYLKAVVLASGSGAKNKKGSLRPLDVQVGDEVLFSEHAGIKIRFNDEDLQIIHETDVMGVIQN